MMTVAPKPAKWPLEPREACPKGIRSELWLTDEEYQYISECLGSTGFKIEKFEDTPRKSAEASVYQSSVHSASLRSAGRQRSVVTSTRLGTSGRNLAQGHEGLSDVERNEYRRLVQLLIRTHKTASQPFLFPVPDTVHGYYDVIKKPVDLTTIRQRLDSNSYRNRGEFEQDFLQMLWNAYTFNPPHTAVFNAALELHSAFVMGLQRSVIALNDLKRSDAFAQIETAKKKRQLSVRRSQGVSDTQPGRQSRVSTSVSSGGSRRTTTEEELRKKLEFLQKVVSKQTNLSSVSSGRKSAAPAPEPVRPLTDRQLDQLADDLEQLDPRHVPHVANILKDEPTAQISEGQLDLSIHELPPTKQRELLNLMERIKTQEAISERLTGRVHEDSDDESGYSKRQRM